MASLIEKLLRTGDKKTLRQLRNYADSINALESSFQTFTDAELREETDRLRARHSDGEKLDDLLPEAFAAVREASDGESFKAEVEAATGLEMMIIPGTEEARLSAQGVLLGWPGARGLVCDIGGSSMELAEIGDNTVGRRVSSTLGPFRLMQVPGGKKGLKAHITKTLVQLREEVGADHKALYLVGGSWRALARLDMERRGYPLTVLHEYEMTPKSIRKTIDWLETQLGLIDKVGLQNYLQSQMG